MKSDQIPDCPLALIRKEPYHGAAAFKMAWAMTDVTLPPSRAKRLAFEAALAGLRAMRTVIESEETRA